jgi:hypothetical protein
VIYHSLHCSAAPPLLNSTLFSIIMHALLCCAIVSVGEWFITMVKRCEKEVEGSWTDKQEQARKWLNFFIPHYRHLCVPGDGCPAKHSPSDQEQRHSQRSDDIEKRWLDGKDPQDEEKIAALQELIDKMKADVHRYVHGHNTCRVESIHSERIVHTPKRIEYCRNWNGKCRVVQLLHNHGVAAAAEMVRQHLGWEVTEDVRAQWRRIDRDRAKLREIKADPSYNRRQWEIKQERKEQKGEAKAAAVAAAKEERKKERERKQAEEGKKEKKRKVVAHTYSMKKTALYGDVGKTGKAEASSLARKRGRPRKRQAGELEASSSGRKENVVTAAVASGSAEQAAKRGRMAV